MKRKKIKTFCLVFYEGEEDLARDFDNMKSKTRTNTIKKLLKKYFTNKEI